MIIYSTPIHEHGQILKDVLERIYRGGNFPVSEETIRNKNITVPIGDWKVSEEIIRNKNIAVPKGNWKVSTPKSGHGFY